VTPENIILAPDEDTAAILEEIMTARDDDPNFVPVVRPRDHRLAAFHDMCDPHLEHLNEDQRTIVTAWFDQARPEASYHDQVTGIGAALHSLRPSAKSDDIGRIFGITQGPVYNHVRNCGWSANPRGRRSVIKQDAANKLKEFLMVWYEDGDPATYAGAWDFLEQQCDVAISLETLRKTSNKCQSSA
jgi:hypothetical protein